MLRLRLFRSKVRFWSAYWIKDGYGHRVRAWEVDAQGQLKLFEGLHSESFPAVKYKNVSHWKNTFRKILSVVKDEGMRVARVEFLVDAPMALRLYKAGTLRLEHLAAPATIETASSLLLPTDRRMARTINEQTQYLCLKWDLLGEPLTLLIAAGRFGPGSDHIMFRVASTMASTIYGIRSPDAADRLLRFEHTARTRYEAIHQRACPVDSLAGMPCVHPEGAGHKGQHQFPHK